MGMTLLSKFSYNPQTIRQQDIYYTHIKSNYQGNNYDDCCQPYGFVSRGPADFLELINDFSCEIWVWIYFCHPNIVTQINQKLEVRIKKLK